MNNEELNKILFSLENVARKHTIEVCENGSKIETLPANVVDELRLNNYSAKILLNYINKQKEVIDKIREILKDPDRDGFDEDGYDDSYYDMIYTNRIKELLEEIE